MLKVYKYFTYLFFPLFIVLIYLRSLFNKEDKIRFKEKIFSSHFKIHKDRNKKLIWFHAASVGECLSIIPLITKIISENRNINILITTVTLTSSELLKKKLINFTNVEHRFLPLDLESLAENFLNMWKPNLVCFVDSEIWPNFLFKIKEKEIPLLLINARLAKKSFNKWKIIPNFARKVFGNFDLCLASSEESKNNLSKFQVKNLIYIGNLKFTGKNTILDELIVPNKKILNNFITWCAVSTHNGEEKIILKTHLEIKKKYHNVMTIIAPRHTNRAIAIKHLSKKFNLKSQIIKDDDFINLDTEILIINSFGVLHRYFNYCKNVFIGKSLIKNFSAEGGQNPIDAVKLGCNIFYGPYVYNFKEIYELLNSYGLAQSVNGEMELASKILNKFDNPSVINHQQISLLNDYGDKILDQTTLEIDSFLK